MSEATIVTMPDLVEPIDNEHFPAHWFVYADPGRQKSTFAATFPKPMLVLSFDPWSKQEPYRRRGVVGPTLRAGNNVIEYVMRESEPDKAIIQIESYFDPNYNDTKAIWAWERFQQRIPTIHEEVNDGVWQTVVLDSISTFELCVRKWEEHVANPTSNQGKEQDARQWYRKSGDAVQEVCYNLGWLQNCNVVILGHVRRERDRIREMAFWQPEMPGSYARKVPGLFSEIYTIHFNPDANPPYQLQTTNNGDYIAATQIPAPNGVAPHYRNLWTKAPPTEKD